MRSSQAHKYQGKSQSYSFPDPKKITSSSLIPATTKVPPKDSTTTGFPNRTKSTLSSKEILDRRAEGLCFHCDDLYHPGKDCKSKLYAMLGENEEESHSEDLNEVIDEMESLLTLVSSPAEISLNAIAGTKSLSTIHLEGFIKKHNSIFSWIVAPHIALLLLLWRRNWISLLKKLPLSWLLWQMVVKPWWILCANSWDIQYRGISLHQNSYYFLWEDQR